MQTTLRYIFFLTLLWCSVHTTFSQNKPSAKSKREIKRAYNDSIKTAELNLKEQDSIKNDSLKNKSFLESNVVYSAKNYMRLNRRNNKMYLYDDAKVKYTDMDIESGSIIIHQSKKEVYAKGIVDTANAYTQTPIFTQGQNVVEPDTIRFNFDTKKALIYNSKTSQSGFNIINEVSKRENDSVVYMKNVRFTTSKNIEDPEYYFYARRIKFVPKKKIVTGLVNMYIADVPTPLGLPFGYFPMKEEAVSGFIFPSFNDSNDIGFTLQNGGYYFAISDYLNLTLVGDYSTNSSFALRADSDYAKRYRFTGNVSIRFENNIRGERGFGNFSKSTNYNIRWSHNQSPKANPTSRFAASVNFGSSQFFQQSRNLTNVGSSLNNELQTSVSYDKRFPTNPEVSITSALSIRQGTQNQNIELATPVTLTVARIYPLAPKVGAKKGILQNINLQLTSSLTNTVDTNDDEIFTSKMLEDTRTGINHNIPISTNFKVLKYISVSAGSTLQERWVFETIDQSYQPQNENSNSRGVLNDTINGFDSFRTYGFTTGLGTTIYGKKEFGKNAKIKAIRHVMRPNVSYNYTPAFDQFYDEYIIPEDSSLNREEEIISYTRFQGGILGAPGLNVSSSLSFSLNNVLEAKVVDRDTTKLEAKKIKILNSLNFNSGYDFKADSLNLRAINVRGSIPIVKKLTLNFGGSLDPYALNSNNQRINRWNIDNGGSLFRLTTANLNFGYSFASTDFEGKKDKDKADKNDVDNETFRNGGRPDDLFGTHTDFKDGSLFEDETDEEKDKKTDVSFYNYKMPWSLRISYSLNYSNSARQDAISAHSLSFSGDIELAPRWKVGASSGYDVLNKGFTFTNLRFQRDLESWRMSFNWVPFSTITSWNFFIGISSSVLSDIKWDKRRQPDRR